MDFVLSKIPCFQHIPSNTFRQMSLTYQSYSEAHFLLDVQTILRLITKTLSRNALKVKAASPIQTMKTKSNVSCCLLIVHALSFCAPILLRAYLRPAPQKGF